ncbi:MAG: class I SAM-dependent methyltransferase [Saprospiraceae bacterium]|nr:class I SAM-dependent methyltransferase [Saprospiraceae bacterium]
MKFIKLYLRIIKRFLRFYWHAQTIYDIHSPFVFEFAKKVIEDRRLFYAFTFIESYRKELLEDDTLIEIKDHGAGSKVNPASARQIKDLAKNSAISARTGRQLFKIVHLYKPSLILELGTSLGISAMYQAAASLRSGFVSVEGCPNTAEVAQENFELMGVPHIQVFTGPFDEVLPILLPQMEQLDYLYMDGDHREGASMAYFEACLAKATDQSVFVIADIHWSAAMENAWSRMQEHPKVTLSIDTFNYGVLFFGQQFKTKEHYRLVSKWWKPWHIGLWK